MPNRILKESICTSNEIDCLSIGAERLFYRLIVQCDDFGRMDARLPIIRARCFPLKLNKIREGDIKKWLKELSGAGLVSVYVVDDKQYLQMSTWDKHQHKRAQISKYPPPPNMPSHEHTIPSEKDVEDLIHSNIQKLDTFLGSPFVSVDRQLRNKEVYVDLFVRTESDAYVLEIKRNRLSNKAIQQVLKYSNSLSSKSILIGNGLSANFDLQKCKDNNIAVIIYDDEFNWSIVYDGGFLINIEWLPDVDIKRDITCNHVNASDAYNREYEKREYENTGNENTRNENAEDAKPKKVTYAEFVKMTEKEYEDLVEKFGEEATSRMIEILDNYKGSKGKKYKSDYRAILSWVVERYYEEVQKKIRGQPGSEYPKAWANIDKWLKEKEDKKVG